MRRLGLFLLGALSAAALAVVAAFALLGLLLITAAVPVCTVVDAARTFLD